MKGEHLDRFWHGVCTMIERDYVSHSTRGDGPHFVAASSVQGALAGTHSLDGWWGGGTGSLKATSSKPVALSSGLLCSKNDSMNL